MPTNIVLLSNSVGSGFWRQFSNKKFNISVADPKLLFRIRYRIQIRPLVSFGFGSGFGSWFESGFESWIRIRIQDYVWQICFGSGFGSEMFISDPDRIRIRPKVSDPYGSGSGSGSATLFNIVLFGNPGTILLAALFLFQDWLLSLFRLARWPASTSSPLPLSIPDTTGRARLLAQLVLGSSMWQIRVVIWSDLTHDLRIVKKNQWGS